MGKFFGALAILALIGIAIIAMDMLNGGQIMLWLQDHTGAPDTSPRF